MNTMEVINRAIDIKKIRIKKYKKIFDESSSDGKLNGKLICPVCNSAKTEPYPGCPCRSEFGFHVNKYHHSCRRVI